MRLVVVRMLGARRTFRIAVTRRHREGPTEGPLFLEMMHEHYRKTLGDRYVPTPPSGGMLRG